jgi:hypothetical protein
MEAALARGERRRFGLAHAAVLLLCLAGGTAILWGVTRERPIAAHASLLRVAGSDVAPLPAGTVLRRGDRLALELVLRRPAYVYVVNRDAKGSEFALFPLEGLDLENPLPAGADHRLPGTIGGKPFSWQVTTEGGAETLMVVVSRERLPELEAAMGRTVRAGEVLRGMGGLAPGGGSKAPARPSSTDVFRDLRKRAGPDLWAWETTVGGAW